MTKKVSIVIPAYNEEENIAHVYTALERALGPLQQYVYEYVFVNDGSIDRTDERMAVLAKSDSRVKCIEFSRNFGKEIATSAGIAHAEGDAIIMIDADMQHPPELLPRFLEEWEGGAEVVIGIRTRNHGEGVIKRWGSWLFHSLMSIISRTDLKKGETDFRLIDRVVADAFVRFPERERMTRALINWLGFKKVYVPFVAPARLHGVAKYSIGKLIHLALYSCIANSLAPLRFAGYLGLGTTLSSGFLGLVVLVNKYVFGDPYGWDISGAAQLTIVNVFLVGIVLTVLGIMSLYIGTITTEVTQRPLYVIRKRINI